jgi:fido (protein-threonine AMPylation protein)
MFERFFLGTTATKDRVSRALSRGEVRRIRRGLYTTDLVTPLPALVRQHIWEVTRLIEPEAVIGYRTAIELTPSPEGVIHLVGPTERRFDVHGTKIWIHEGPGPLQGDQPYMHTLYLASRPRAFLEVLKPSRAGRKFGNKGLSAEEVEQRLDRLLRVRGEGELNHLRDQARSLAGELEAEEELQKLDATIGALLGTKEAALTSRTARARAAGHPHDPDRLRLFQELHRLLLENPLPDVPARYPPGTRGFSNGAFFDAYFSNWIEGTRFELDEAHEIVTRGVLPEARPADGHDILGTFGLVSDPAFMTGALARMLASPDGLVDVLHEAHRRIMSGRPEHAPGRFKTQPNRAGTTLFVAPDLVPGTLREVHGLLATLPDGLAKAAYLMFAISEVHPYADGNGRVARAVMNAALVASDRSRMIIVSGYRDDYLRALKALSHQKNASPFVQMLARAQRFVGELPLEDYDRTVEVLGKTGALDDSGDRRLRLPGELPVDTLEPT